MQLQEQLEEARQVAANALRPQQQQPVCRTPPPSSPPRSGTPTRSRPHHRNVSGSVARQQQHEALQQLSVAAAVPGAAASVEQQQQQQLGLQLLFCGELADAGMALSFGGQSNRGNRLRPEQQQQGSTRQSASSKAELAAQLDSMRRLFLEVGWGVARARMRAWFPPTGRTGQSAAKVLVAFTCT